MVEYEMKNSKRDDDLNKKKVMRNAEKVFMILAGNALLAFDVAAFVIPHDIIMGGTTGIGIVLGKATGFETAAFVMVLNVLLLFLGMFILGKQFFVSTAASSLLYPAFLGLMQRIPGIDRLTDDATLSAIFAGVLMGISLGLVMRVGSSTGGTDIICLILAKFFHRPVAVFVYVVDIAVIGGQAIFSKPQNILLGIVLLVLETIMLEKVMILGKSQIQIFAVSEKYEEIRERFLDDLNAGVTLTEIETGMLAKHQKAVMCVIPPRKQYAATELIRAIDPAAFITITQINEVRGRGFTVERAPIEKTAKQ